MRWQDRRSRTPLPVDERLEDLMTLAKSERVVIVSTDRRTGATTRIPQALFFANPGEQIRVSLPRRLSVMAAGTRILNELGGKRRESVNWQTGVARKRSREWNAQILLSAHKAMIHRIRDHAGFLPEGWFVMDDAHVRTSEGTLLLGFLRAGIERSLRTNILILTDDEHAEEFSDFFGKAPIFRITRPREEVRDEVIPAASGLFGAAENILASFAAGELSSGSVMMLSHGREAAAKLALHIRNRIQAAGLSERVRVFEGHATVANDQLERLLRPASFSTLRFICGTEILRAGATPPDLIGIVDSLMVRRMQSDDGVEWSVRTVPLSRDEARCTREMLTEAPGRFYQTIGCAWEDLESDDPQNDRLTMTETVLELAASGARVQDIAFLYPPDVMRMENAASYLLIVGALNKQGLSTDIGRQMLEFPLDPPLSRVLLAAAKRKVLPEAMLAVAFLQVGGIFSVDQDAVEDGTTYSADAAKIFFPQGHPAWFVRTENGYRIDAEKILRPRDAARMLERAIRTSYAHKSGNDFLASINAYRAFKTMERKSSTHERQLRQWCRERFLNYERIRLADALVNRIREEIEGETPLHHQPEYDIGFSVLDLTKSLIAGLPYRIGRRAKEGEWHDRIGDFVLSHSSCCPRDAPFLFTGGITFSQPRSSGNGKQKPEMRICSFAVPVALDWIREVFADHLERRRLFGVQYDPQADRVVEREEERLFDLTLESRAIAVTEPARAVPIIAQWMVEHPDQARQQRLKVILAENKRWAQENGVKDDRLYEFYEQRLHGKVRVADLENVSALPWPDMVERISMAPVYVSAEDVRIGNRIYRLTRRGGQSTVTFDEAFIAEGAWKELPDYGWNLPNGDTLDAAVRLRHARARLRSTDPAVLKQQIREYLNDQIVAATPVPEMALPDWNDPRAEIPPVMRMLCGEDALDGTPLYAYATLEVAKDADPLDPFLRPVVYRQYPLAESLQASLQNDLPALRTRGRTQLELLRLFAAACDVQERLRAWVDQNGEDERMPIAQREKARGFAYASILRTSAWLEKWIQRARPFYISLHDLTARASVVPEVPSV